MGAIAARTCSEALPKRRAPGRPKAGDVGSRVQHYNACARNCGRGDHGGLRQGACLRLASLSGQVQMTSALSKGQAAHMLPSTSKQLFSAGQSEKDLGDFSTSFEVSSLLCCCPEALSDQRRTR